MYRRGMAFLMAEIKAKTDKFITHKVLEDYDKPPEAPKPKNFFAGFQTALQVSKNQATKSPEIESKSPELESESPGENGSDKSPELEWGDENPGENVNKEENPDENKSENKESKVKEKLKLLGLSEDESEDEKEENPVENSSETSSSPEIEKNDVELFPKEPPEMEKEEEEIAVKPEMSQEEKVAKLEDTIKLLQQQMAEANDHINYEMKMKSKRDKSPHRKAFKPPRKVEKPENSISTVSFYKKTAEKSRKTPEKPKSGVKEHKSKTPEKVNKDKSARKTPDKHKEHRSKTPEKAKTPKKIKVRVEIEKTEDKKRSKSETADALVKLLVPYFKKGLIASKQVFKITARELTHSVLKTRLNSSQYSDFVESFFSKCGKLESEEDAKEKIANYKQP